MNSLPGKYFGRVRRKRAHLLGQHNAHNSRLPSKTAKTRHMQYYLYYESNGISIMNPMESISLSLSLSLVDLIYDYIILGIHFVRSYPLNVLSVIFTGCLRRPRGLTMVNQDAWAISYWAWYRSCFLLYQIVIGKCFLSRDHEQGYERFVDRQGPETG